MVLAIRDTSIDLRISTYVSFTGLFADMLLSSNDRPLSLLLRSDDSSMLLRIDFFGDSSWDKDLWGQYSKLKLSSSSEKSSSESSSLFSIEACPSKSASS